MTVKVKNNRPTYSPFLQCYIIDYSVDGQKASKVFENYKDGINWLKFTFPLWFKKHYSQTIFPILK